MILLKLFFTFFKIGLLAIGGAYSFLPLVEREAVQYHHWLDKAEFVDVTGIVAIFPGAISIKFATYIGYKVGGIPGAVAANMGNLLPPMLLILTATYVYSKYRDLPVVKGAFTMVRCAVFTMIIAVAIQTVDTSRILQLKYLVVIAVSFALFFLPKVHPAFIIIGAGAFGAILELLVKA